MLGAHMAIVWKAGVELQPGMSLLKIRDSRIKELKGSGGHIGESEEDLAAFLEDVPFSYSGPAICFVRRWIYIDTCPLYENCYKGAFKRAQCHSFMFAEKRH